MSKLTLPEHTMTFEIFPLPN